MIRAKMLEHRVVREFALFCILFFVGCTALPVLVFVVGQALFGNYGGHGFAGFFGELWTKVAAGEFYAWFLVLAPYLAWQTIRLMAAGWRAAGRVTAAAPRDRAQSGEL